MTTFEILGRTRKAATIADFLIGKGMTADDVRTGLEDEAVWKLIASELCMKNVASPETRALVVEQMEVADRLWQGEET